MRKIAIVGGGQAGMLLAFGLLEKNYDVTLYSDRSAEEVLHGRLPSTAMFFESSLAVERSLGLNFWESTAAYGQALYAEFRAPNGDIMLPVLGMLGENRGIAMDQRTKYHRWMLEYQQRGGKLQIGAVEVADLESIAASHELTILAAGKGSITSLFQRDDKRSVHQKPPRLLAAALVTGDGLTGPNGWAGLPSNTLHFNFIAGAGEYFSMPFYSHSKGACRSFLFEAVPGGPMDIFGDVKTGDDMLACMRQAVSTLTPDQAHRLPDNLQLSDPNSWLKGSFLPEVRKPVATLGNGGLVWGIGDTVVLNDPIAGQGANNATRMMRHYLDAILLRGEQAFDEDWMTTVFESFWTGSARYTTEFTNMLLKPPTPSLLQVLGAASQNPRIAADFMGGFNNPINFWPAVDGEEGALAYLSRKEFCDAA